MMFLRSLSEFLKIDHALFSLPVVFSGAFLAAGGLFGGRLFLLMVVAGTGARTFALAVNRIFDREIDGSNPRTEQRALPSGKVTLVSAVAVAVSGLLAYLLCAWLICPFVFYLSPLPLAVFIVYPLMKRFTSLCHFGVGFALALAPVAGWLAVTCSFSSMMPAVAVGLFTFFWISGFDVIYATADEEFDRNYGLFSLVCSYGRKKALEISRVCHVLAVVSLVFLYFLSFRTVCALFPLAACGYLLYLEHRNFGGVTPAFFRTNVLVGFMVLFFILAGIYLP